MVRQLGGRFGWRDDGMVTDIQQPVLLGGYAAKRCPVRVHNDFSPSVQTLDWIPSSEDQARIDAGIAFERAIFEDLLVVHPASVVVDPQLNKADMIAMTVQAMDAGAPLILGGRLPDDVEHGRTGRPDVLIRVENGYLPADVKNHQTLHPLTTNKVSSTISSITSPDVRLPLAGWTAATSHRYEDGLQLAHYTRLLQSSGYHPGVEHVQGAILGTSQLELTPGASPQLVFVWHNLDEALFSTFSRSRGKKLRSLLERYDHEHAFRVKVAEIARRITGGDDDPEPLVEPIGQAECQKCPYGQRCAEQMGVDDPSAAITIGRLGSREWLTLRRMGVTTTAALCAVDPDDEVFFDRYFAELRHLSLGEARKRLAAAIGRAEMICNGVELERTSAGPVEVPVADIEIDLDIEYDLDNRVYIWGARLRYGADDSTAKYVNDFIEWYPLSSLKEQALAARFVTWLRRQRTAAEEAGQSLKVFHWSHAERSKLTKVLGEAEVWDLLDPETGVFIDLEKVFKANFVSLHGSSIKRVAPQYGFTWRVDDPGGAISQTYLSQVRISTNEHEVAAAKTWLLTYNEDDTAAMAKVRDGMRTWRP